MCETNPMVITDVLRVLVNLLEKRCQTASSISSNGDGFSFRCISMMDFLVDKTTAYFERENFGDNFEAAIAPMFRKLKQKQILPLDEEIIELLTKFVSARKSRSLLNRTFAYHTGSLH